MSMNGKADRREQHAIENSMQFNIDTSKALGYDELGRYKNNTVSKGQERFLSEADSAGKTRASEYAKKAGLNDAATNDLEFQNSMNQVLLKESMHENTWAKAVMAFGFSRIEAAKLVDYHMKQRQQQAQIFSQLFGVIGGVIGGIYGGPAGAAGGAGAGSALGSEIGG